MQYKLCIDEYGLYNHFARFAPKPLKKALSEKPPELPDDFSFKQMLDFVISNDNITYLIVGESHIERASESFLCRYKTELASGGYEILAKEFYCTTQQLQLDSYCYGFVTEPPSSATSPLMELMGVLPRHNVVRELHKEGFRTIALEDSRVLYVSAANPNRIREFDDCAVRAIDKEVTRRKARNEPISMNARGKGKVVIHVGAVHAPGIAERLGRSRCVMICARDSPNLSEYVYEAKASMYNIVFDIVLSVPTEKASPIGDSHD